MARTDDRAQIRLRRPGMGALVTSLRRVERSSAGAVVFLLRPLSPSLFSPEGGSRTSLARSPSTERQRERTVDLREICGASLTQSPGVRYLGTVMGVHVGPERPSTQ